MRRSSADTVSLHQVASAAGTSTATVSRVLNNSGYVSAELRRRVESAVEAVGYVPNFNARHLKTGRSGAIGLMVSNLANPFLSNFFAAVERHMQLAGYSLLVASTYDQRERESRLLTLFENRRLEGVIASPSQEGLPRDRCVFAKSKLPMVIFDREMCFESDVVFQGHRQGVSQAVAYLASLGHTRIALFGPNETIRPGREKLRGYVDGLDQAGITLDPDLLCMADSAISHSEDRMARMLSLDDPPTALIGLGTRLLSDALRVLRAARRRIPEDFSVVGIGTEDIFAMAHPVLTTLRFDMGGMAEAVATLMLERISSGSSAPPRSVTVKLDLVIGQSSAARRTPADMHR